MNWKRFKACVVLALLTCVCYGQKAECTSECTQKTKAWYEDEVALRANLAAAVADARVLDASKVSHTLVPIRKDYPGEEWINVDGHDMVLVVTLVDSARLKRFFSGEDTYRIIREMGTWVTLPGEWVAKRTDYEGLDSIAAHMRMIQMYGLDPSCNYDIMVSFYADVDGIFRPAHDPSINTASAGLEFPGYADENYKVGETNFREWYRYSVSSAYEDESPLPWTQLGYTYDWHHGASRQGLSEYIVTHKSLIKVKKSETAWDFIKNLLK